MKSLKTVQVLFRLGKILSKVAFILSIVALCCCLAGLIGLNVGNGEIIKLGGVTLHDLIPEKYGVSIKSVSASLIGWLVVCAGEAVLAKAAETCFGNELAAGTPFTSAGAKEMLRLGILTLAVPTGCAVVGSIVRGVVAGFMKAEESTGMGLNYDNAGSIALGVMFIVVSFLCRYGAELREN